MVLDYVVIVFELTNNNVNSNPSLTSVQQGPGPHLAGGGRNWDVIVTPGVWGCPPAPEPDTQRTGFIVPAHQ